MDKTRVATNAMTGGGASLTGSLLARKGRAKALDGENPTIFRPPAKPATILIVEEDDLNLKLYTDLLEARGYRIVAARTPDSAPGLARMHRPGLIVVDLHLPRLSGLDTAKVVKQDPDLQSVPVIALAEIATPEDEIRLRDHGFDARVAKPISVARFFETVERFLD